MTYMREQIAEVSINGLKQSLQKMPDFDHYNASHQWTQSLKQMWLDTDRCGGPITSKLNSETSLDIPTPDIDD